MDSKTRLIKEEYHIVPLSGGFMLTSIVGFLISVFYVYPNNNSWGFTLTLFFVIMFVASMVSMTYAPSEWSFNRKNKNL